MTVPHATTNNSYILNTNQNLHRQELSLKQPLLLTNEFNHNFNNNMSFRQYMGASNLDPDYLFMCNKKISSGSRSESCGPTIRSSSLQRTFAYNSKYN